MEAFVCPTFGAFATSSCHLCTPRALQDKDWFPAPQLLVESGPYHGRGLHPYRTGRAPQPHAYHRDQRVLLLSAENQPEVSTELGSSCRKAKGAAALRAE